MARVDNVATYEHQGFIKVQVALCTAKKFDHAERLQAMLRSTNVPTWEPGHGAVPPDPNTMMGADDLDELERSASMWRFASRGYSTMNALTGTTGKTIGRMLADFLDATTPRVVMADQEARSWFCGMVYAGDIIGTFEEKHERTAAFVSSRIFENQIWDAKLSSGKACEAWSQIALPYDNAIVQYATYQWVEQVFTRRTTEQQVKEIDKYSRSARDFGLDMVQMSVPQLRRGKLDFYRIGIFWLIMDTTSGTLLIMDMESTKQVVECVSSWSNWHWSGGVAKAHGPPGLPLEIDATDRLTTWIGRQLQSAILAGAHPNAVAKHAKAAVGALTCELFKENEPAAVLDGINASIAHDIAEAQLAWPASPSFYEAMHEAVKDPLWRVNMGYIFHIVPGADADPAVLFAKTVANMNDARVCNHESKARFIRYMKTHVLVCTVSARAEMARYIVCDDGYNIREQAWFKVVLKGRRTAVPEEEWGRATIQGALHWSPMMDIWWLGAADVTHVSSDKDMELSDAPRSREDNMNVSELVYAMRYGAKMSKTVSPDDVRRKIRAKVFGNANEGLILTAAKAENTKYGVKCREIFAACDQLREAQSELDRNMAVAAKHLPGNMMRQSAIAIDKQMSEFAEGLDGRAKAIACCQDISEWSTKMDRNLLFECCSVFVDMFVKDALPYTLQDIWKHIQVGINKRGVVAASRVDKGAFMGFTGSLDSAIHSAMLAYLVRTAKDEHILLDAGDRHSAEHAHTAALIDDAAVLLRLRTPMSDDETAERVARFGAHMVLVYASLSCKVDAVKSVVSACKAVFLNRVYGGGGEIPTWAKIAARVRRDINKQFATLQEQVNEVFGRGKGAVERGAPPLAMYKLCTWMSCKYFLATVKTDVDINAAADAMRLPPALEGIGVPSLVEWLGPGRRDTIASWASEVSSKGRIASIVLEQHPHDVQARIIKDDAEQLLASVMNAPLARRNDWPLALLAAPCAVTFEGQIDPTMPSKSLFKSIARSVAFAPEVCAMLLQEDDPNLMAAVEEGMLQGSHDAAVLEKVGMALPSAMADAWNAKARSSETLTKYGNWKMVKKAKVATRNASYQHAMRALRKVRTALGSIDSSVPGSVHATKLRERMYNLMGVVVTNHTCPAATEHIAQTEQESSLIKMTYTGIKACMGYTSGMWDWGKRRGPRDIGFRVRGVPNLGGAALRTMPSPIKRVVNALVSCRWSSDNKKGSFYELLLAQAWTGDCMAFNTVLTPAWKGDSLKKFLSMTAQHQVRIAAFPNVQGTVVVNTSSYFPWLDRQNTMMNGAAVVQELKLLGLLDMYTGGFGENSTRRYTAYVDLLGPQTEKADPAPPTPETVEAIKRVVVANAPAGTYVATIIEAVKLVHEVLVMDTQDANEADEIAEMSASVPTNAFWVSTTPSMPLGSSGYPINPESFSALHTAVNAVGATADVSSAANRRTTMTNSQLKMYALENGRDKMSYILAAQGQIACRWIAAVDCLERTFTPSAAYERICAHHQGYRDLIEHMMSTISRAMSHSDHQAFVTWVKVNTPKGWVADDEYTDAGLGLSATTYEKWRVIMLLAWVRAGFITTRASYAHKYARLTPQATVTEIGKAIEANTRMKEGAAAARIATRAAERLNDKSTGDEMMAAVIHELAVAKMIPWEHRHASVAAITQSLLGKGNGASALFGRVRDAVAVRKLMKEDVHGNLVSDDRATASVSDTRLATMKHVHMPVAPNASVSFNFSMTVGRNAPSMDDDESAAPLADANARMDDETLKKKICARFFGPNSHKLPLDDLLRKLKMTKEEAKKHPEVVNQFLNEDDDDNRDV